jgi:hypothetical protein
MSKSTDVTDLITCFKESPYPSFKATNYFRAYASLFSHLRGTDCTFIETGILLGGSLFMWRNWLGSKARIIGIDLNPEARKWASEGFEIYIGDQGDPLFWEETLKRIGRFDVLLDDGGHQSFQQAVTLSSCLRANKGESVVVVEDTATSFYREFSGHHQYSFTEYCKDATDMLLAKTSKFWPGQFPEIRNPEMVELFSSVYSIEFFAGLIAFKSNPEAKIVPDLCWNIEPTEPLRDFRYAGVESALVEWPDLFTKKTIRLSGGSS